MDNVIWQGDEQHRWHEETLSWKTIPQIEQYNADIAEDVLLSNKWFELNSSNEVINIVKADNITSLDSNHTFIQARKSGRINYNAGIGYSYSSELDDFIPLQPAPSWTLDETTLLWKPPIEPLGRVKRIGIASSGSDYVSSSNLETFNTSPNSTFNVGIGTGLIVNINTVDGFIVDPVEIVNSGNGYRRGDAVSISTSNTSGSGALFGILEVDLS